MTKADIAKEEEQSTEWWRQHCHSSNTYCWMLKGLAHWKTCLYNWKGEKFLIAWQELKQQQHEEQRLKVEVAKAEKLKEKTKILKSFDPDLIMTYKKKKATYDKYCHTILNRKAPWKITELDTSQIPKVQLMW